MSDEQEKETPKSNGKLSSILNDDDVPISTTVKSRQEPSKMTTNITNTTNTANTANTTTTTTTTTNGSSGRPSSKIKKPQPPKEAATSKTDNSSKITNKPKSSKQTKTTTSSKAKTRKRPLSPSDSEEGRETSYELEGCRHPKHDEYMKSKPPPVVVSNKKAKRDKPPKLVGMPKRLEGVLNIDRGTKMCSRCINQTDKDPQYTSHKKYVSRQSVYKKNERSRLMIDMNGK